MMAHLRRLILARLRSQSAAMAMLRPLVQAARRWWESNSWLYYHSWARQLAARARQQVAPAPAAAPLLFIALQANGPGGRQRSLAALAAQTDAGWRLLECGEDAAAIAATQHAAAAQAGWWLLLREGEVLAAHAVARLRSAAQAPDVSVIYADEDAYGPFGLRFRPWLKPGFDPDLLLTQNLFGYAVAYRATALTAHGSSGHALALAQTAPCLRGGATGVDHVADILLSRPLHTAAPWRELDPVAVQAALAADGRGATLAPGLHGLPRVVWPQPQPAPLVSVIIPTRDRLDLLGPCVEDVLNRTEYPAIEVLIADNDSRDPTTLAQFKAWQQDPRVRILPCPGAFNYSRINNQAVGAAGGEMVLLLNNDTAVLNPNWLEEMVALAARPEVGAVGARLLYPNGRVQHAGVALGFVGVAGHDLAFRAGDDPGPEDALCHTRSISAVTAACLLVRRSLFLAVGGLDETALRVAYNDVDLCLRIREAGFRNLITPHACLLHKESASRGADMAPEHRARWQAECAVMQDRWGPLLREDPYFNPLLARSSINRGLARLGSAALPGQGQGQQG